MSARDGPRDDDRDHDHEGRPDAERPSIDPGAPDLLTRLGLTLPDDARELDADLRELELERLTGHPSAGAGGPRRSGLVAVVRAGFRRVHRFVGAPGRPGPGAAPLLALALLAMAGVIAGSLSLLTPRITVSSPSALPIATTAQPQADGAAGATDSLTATAWRPPTLLPEGQVRRAGIELPARDLRPAALLIARDPRCADCAQALRDVVADAEDLALPVSLVVPADAEEAGGDVVRENVGGGAEVVSDLDGSLVRTFGATDPQLVLVHADGVVAEARSAGDGDGADPEPELEPLLEAGATPEATASASVR
jgi:hypothetical protein